MTPQSNRRAGHPVTGRRRAGVLAAALLGAAVFIPQPAVAAVPDTSGPTSAAPACVGQAVTTATDLKTLVAADTKGSTFCLKAGTYYGFSITPKANQSFIGEPGVVLSGAKKLTMVKDGTANRWKATGQTQQGYVWKGAACPADRPGCQLPEELFVNNVRQEPVLSLSQLAAGKFFFDYAADTIYMGSDPTGKVVETSHVPAAFFNPHTSPQANVTIANLVVEKYATPGHMHAIGLQALSPGWTVRNTEVRFNHGGGIGINGGKALNNHVHHNGHQGISGTGANTVVEGNEIAFNNAAGYDPGMEGGAGKFSNTTNLVYRNNHVHDNYGQGPWTDINNLNTLYENNVVENNDGVGIMHEISYDATIRNNTLRDNGRKGAYAYSANILVSSSRNVTVSGNTVLVGKTSADGSLPSTRMGIIILQGNRTGDNCDRLACVSINNTVENNLVWYLHELNNLGRGAGLSGTGIMQNGNADQVKNNVFRNNLYAMPTCTAKRFHWTDLVPNGDPSGSLADWQAQGQETGSVCRSNG
jgi:parallel beta-helix repeat protein